MTDIIAEVTKLIQDKDLEISDLNSHEGPEAEMLEFELNLLIKLREDLKASHS